MMDWWPSARCPGCKTMELEIVALRAEIATLHALVKSLEEAQTATHELNTKLLQFLGVKTIMPPPYVAPPQ